MAALTPSAAKAMGGEMIHCSTTVVAGVRSTEGDPSLRPTATLMVLLSILRSRDEIGRAFSQAPDSLVEAAKRQAIEVALEALSNRESAVADIRSSGSWMRYQRGEGGHDPETTVQQHRQHWGEGHSGDEKEGYDGQDRRSQQQRPRRQRVPAELHSGCRVHQTSPEGKLGFRQDR